MKALVIGGARSGIGVTRLLVGKGYRVTLATNADFPERVELEGRGVNVVLNDRDLSLVQDYDLVVKNPGIPNDHPLVAQFSAVLNEIDIAYRFSTKYRYLAISGTNGKTTATTLLHAMLAKVDTQALLAGNVGLALSEAVATDGDFERSVALEIAAFQMEGTPSFTPEIYGILNLSPDHLDRFENEAAYYNAKLRILSRVPVFVRNADDPRLVSLTQHYQGELIDISLKNTDSTVRLFNDAIYYNDVCLFERRNLHVVGNHNVMNAAMAATIAYRAGIPLDAIREAIAEFRAVEHRIEFVRELRGVSYYNDSKATNPESTQVALEAFDGPLLILLGGYDKHISFDILKPYEGKMRKIYIYGESAAQLQAVFPQALRVTTMAEGLLEAAKVACSGDVVLLSPACASYDQFDNYEQRGKIYKDLVHTLE